MKLGVGVKVSRGFAIIAHTERYFLMIRQNRVEIGLSYTTRQENQIDWDGFMSFKALLRSVLLVAVATGLFACSSGGDGNTTVVTTETNSAPVASDITVEMTEDGIVEAILPAVDEEGDELTFTIVSQPDNGSVEIIGNKAIYTPDEDFFGRDSFSFQVSDGTRNSAVAAVTFNIAGVADEPVAKAIIVSTSQGTDVEVILEGSDADGDDLTYTVLDQPANGSLSAVVGNMVTYTPHINFNGVDSFTYKVNDGGSDSQVVAATLNVTFVNNMPVAANVTANTNEDTATEVTLQASDVDNNVLVYTALTQPENGTLGVITGGKVIYTPAANYNGADSFTYKVNDGFSDSDAAEVQLNISAVNDLPVALMVTSSTSEDSSTEVVLQASDVDNNTLIYELVTQPVSGALSAIVGNKVTYTPQNNFNGADSFSYKVYDGTGYSEAATVTLSIQGVNDAPVSTSIAASVDENSSLEVVLQASDIEGDSLTFEIIAQPSHGTLSAISSNKVTYNPATDFSGSDSFTYKASDENASSIISTVTLTVNHVNSKPVSREGSASADMNEEVTLTLSATDADSGEVLTYTIVEQPEHGSLSLITDNKVVYTPEADYVGTDSFVFKVNDGEVDSNNSNFNLSIAPLNIGQLIDSPVSGLHYSTGGFEGITDSEGRFRYNSNGDPVYFSLGNKFLLGQALSDEKVHIYDFKETEDEALSGKNKRIAQILQSLDTDGNSANGIQLPSDINEKISESPKLNFLAEQVDFDEALKTALTDWEVEHFVSYEDAKSDADKFALELLQECPLTLPVIIDLAVNTSMSCLDRARVYFYDTRISPLLRQSLLSDFDQTVIIEEEYTEEAVSEIIKTNTLLSALQGVDALIGLDEANSKTDELKMIENLVLLLTASSKTVIHAIYNDVETEDNKEELIQTSRYLEAGTELIQGLLHTPYCVKIIGDGTKASNADVAECTKGIINLINLSKSLEYFELADKEVVEEVVIAFIASLKGVIAFGELTDLDKSIEERIRAAFGLAEALVGVARQGIVMSLANGKDIEPGVNFSYLAVSSIDTIVTPFLVTAKECAQKPSGTQLAKCYSAATQEFGKLAMRAGIAIAGSVQTVAYIKTMNDSIVAGKVLEEFLAVGSANHKLVYEKYKTTYGGSDFLVSIRLDRLIAEVGKAHGYAPINNIDPWFVEVWRASIDRNPFSVVRAKALVLSYYSRIVNEAPLEFYSINAEMSATIHSENRGHATIEVVADFSDIGLKYYSVACYSDEGSSYPLGVNAPNLWSSDMESLVPVTFEISYSNSGLRGVFCNFYRKSPSSRYLGSQTIALVIDGYDNDADGLQDQWELQFPQDTNNPNQPYLDTTVDDSNLDADGDGLSNQQEQLYETSPIEKDTDQDGIPDGWEVENSLNPLVNDANEDEDSDGISNIQEFNYEMKPFTNFNVRIVGTNTASLSWDVVEDIAYYNVCYTKEPIPDGDIEDCVSFSDGNWSSGIYDKTNYLVRSLQEGSTYYLRVAAYDSLDTMSHFSNEISITIPELDPSNMDLQRGLVAHYEFENNTNDSSSNLSHGIEYGNIDYADGVIGKAANFDGIDDYIGHDDVLLFNAGSKYSVSGWFNTLSGANIIDTTTDGLGSSGSGGLSISIDPIDGRFHVSISSSEGVDNRIGVYEDSQDYQDGEWHHFVVKYDGTLNNAGIEIYIDNVKKSPILITYLYVSDISLVGSEWSEALQIGRTHHLLEEYYFSGKIDDLRIYDRILNDLEVNDLYKLSTGIIQYLGTEYGYARSPSTNRVWLDRNLGAQRACESISGELCFGDYYQWGRGSDGHEKLSPRTDTRTGYEAFISVHTVNESRFVQNY